MVKKEQLTAANALLQGTTSLGIIIGPVISGLGIAFSGSQDVLCINAVTYLASAALLISPPSIDRDDNVFAGEPPDDGD